MTGRKYEPPLYLDMDFGEALERFSQVDKKEADELAAQAKKKKPPEPKAPAAKTRQKATPSSRTKVKPDG